MLPPVCQVQSYDVLFPRAIRGVERGVLVLDVDIKCDSSVSFCLTGQGRVLDNTRA